MTLRLTEIVVDCRDARALAAFWSAALGYAVVRVEEDQIEIGPWEQEPTDLADQVRRGPTPPSIVFVVVGEGNLAEPTTGPSAPTRKHNRLHLDIRAGDEDRDDVVASLIARGAAKLWDGHQGPYRWVTMVDPEGNEFCVA